MNIERHYGLEDILSKLFRFADCKGGGGPRIDYAAIQRQQDQERQRLQGIADEKYRVHLNISLLVVVTLLALVPELHLIKFSLITRQINQLLLKH